jgi:hypothetical protein
VTCFAATIKKIEGTCPSSDIVRVKGRAVIDSKTVLESDDSFMYTSGVVTIADEQACQRENWPGRVHMVHVVTTRFVKKK